MSIANENTMGRKKYNKEKKESTDIFQILMGCNILYFPASCSIIAPVNNLHW
jgi:hypothetical protein